MLLTCLPQGLLVSVTYLCHCDALLGSSVQVDVVRSNPRSQDKLQLGCLHDALFSYVGRMEWSGDDDVCVKQVPVKLCAPNLPPESPRTIAEQCMLCTKAVRSQSQRSAPELGGSLSAVVM